MITSTYILMGETSGEIITTSGSNHAHYTGSTETASNATATATGTRPGAMFGEMASTTGYDGSPVTGFYGQSTGAAAGSGATALYDEMMDGSSTGTGTAYAGGASESNASGSADRMYDSSQSGQSGAYADSTSAAAAAPSPSSTDTASESVSHQQSVRFYSNAHALFMGLAFLFLFPLGVLLMVTCNFGGLVWVHAICQIVGWVLMIIGFVLGLKLGRMKGVVSFFFGFMIATFGR